MAVYTKNYLKQVAGNATLNENTRLFSQRDSIHNYFDIFLCHSYLDKDVIKGLYIELTRAGFSVYVDWIIDPHLDRENVTKASAEQVRQRLRSSKSLLLAFSTNAQLSKWIPWELGYVDGHVQNCALVPVAENSRASYERSEYLLLYPEFLKPGTIPQERDTQYIVESANQYVEVKNWLAGAKPAYRSTNLY
jgi:hypothetical protein